MIRQPSKVHLQIYGLRNKGMLLTQRLKHNMFWMKSFKMWEFDIRGNSIQKTLWNKFRLFIFSSIFKEIQHK